VNAQGEVEASSFLHPHDTFDALNGLPAHCNLILEVVMLGSIRSIGFLLPAAAVMALSPSGDL
jgi:hypothetical protein